MTERDNYIDKMPTRNINIFVCIVIILFTIVLSGFLLVKRPDIVIGNIKLIAHNQPFELLAPHTGELMLLTRTQDSVYSSQNIAYISNSTDYQTVENLINVLEKRDYSYIYKELNDYKTVKNLGILNSSCMELRTAIYKYITFYDKSLFEETKCQLETDIATLENQIKLQSNIYNIEQNNLGVTTSSFKEDSILYQQKSITKMEFDRSYKALLAQKKQYIGAENTLLAYKKEKVTKELKLQELFADNKNSIETLQQEVERSISILQNDIRVWHKQYVITSPINGKLEIITSIEDKQIVTQNSPVLRILPMNKDIIGQIIFTTKESGDIQDSALVKIYLDSYSKSQNGYLIACLSNISSSVYTVQNGESVHSAKVHINFSEQPYFHGKFHFVHGMTGQAEIIVKKKNILTQIINIISSNT